MRSYYIRVLLRIENVTYIYHTLIFMGWVYAQPQYFNLIIPPAGSDFALRATQGQSQLLAVPIASPKTLCARRERQALDAGRKGRV